MAVFTVRAEEVGDALRAEAGGRHRGTEKRLSATSLALCCSVLFPGYLPLRFSSPEIAPRD